MKPSSLVHRQFYPRREKPTQRPPEEGIETTRTIPVKFRIHIRRQLSRLDLLHFSGEKMRELVSSSGHEDEINDLFAHLSRCFPCREEFHQATS